MHFFFKELRGTVIIETYQCTVIVGECRHRCEDDIKMDLKTWCEGVYAECDSGWNLSHGGLFVNPGMDLWFP